MAVEFSTASTASTARFLFRIKKLIERGRTPSAYTDVAWLELVAAARPLCGKVIAEGAIGALRGHEMRPAVCTVFAQTRKKF